MRYFFRSIRYLWPYRVRLGMATACVVLIMLFWAGGLGALLPGVKILTSDEGLHDWAWRSMAEDRIGGQIVVRTMRGPHSFNEQKLDTSDILDVVKLQENSSAKAAGLNEAEWSSTHDRLPVCGQFQLCPCICHIALFLYR